MLRYFLAVILVLVTILLMLAAAFSGRVVALPGWATDRIETSLNAGLPEGRIELGAAVMEVRRGALPRVTLQNLTLIDGGGARIADLNAVQARLETGGLFKGEAEPARIDLSGAQITFRRGGDGRVSVSFGGAVEAADETLSGLLDNIDDMFEQAPLRSTRQINADALTITLEDARSGRIWQATNASLQLDRTSDSLAIAIHSELFNGTDDLAEIEFELTRDRGTGRSEFSAAIRDMAARDIALQSPILSYLGVLDAPISGEVTASLDGLGLLENMAARLEIAEGSLRPSAQTLPIAFQSGLSTFTYDPASERITFEELIVETEAGYVEASGHAYLRERVAGWPSVLLAQIAVSSADIAAGPLLSVPLSLTEGHADLRLRLDPFTLDVGRLTISEGETRFDVTGSIVAEDDGWSLGLDGHVEEIAPDKLLSLWPEELARGTRNWISANLLSARLSGIDAAIRMEPGQEPGLAMDFDFAETEIRYLPDHPPITGGVGHASILNKRFALFVQEGTVAAPDKGPVDLAGSIMTIPDIAADPARAEISLVTEGSLGAHLALFSLPPVRLEERAGYDIERARADFAGRGELSFDLLKDLSVDEVAWRAEATLSHVQSDKLVPGRILAADRLDVEASPRGIAISGASVLDGVPLNGRWSQAFGPQSDGGSRVDGVAELTPDSLAAFGVTLPEGMVSGSAEAELSLSLVPGENPALELTSDLVGLGLRVGAVNWSKPAEREAEFTLSATLGDVPSVDALALTAPGLRAEGRVALGPEGAFEALELDRLRTGGWMDASVRLTAQGGNAPPRMALTGGSIDIREMSFGRGGQGGQAAPLDLALDRVILSDGLELRSVTGRLTTGTTMSGTFQGRVNGGARLDGALIPVNAGTAIRLQAGDAGAVFRDAGIFKSTYGGEADVILSPTNQPGIYDGQLLVQQVALRGAAPLAALIDAISVVGLLDELNGPGILFDDVEAAFTLTPSQVRIQRASAVGPSIGVSIDGVYTMAARTVDFQGVISPVYFLNGIGAVLTRRGEGLFGFNFTMQGAADTPAVRVNPLSILTPGMFREIFRRPPPSATGQ